MNKLQKLSFASAVSASIIIAATAIITIWAELSPAFKDGLKNLTGHHWLTKSVFVLIGFPLLLAVLYGLLRREISYSALHKSLWVLIWTAVIGSAAVLGFFAWHYLL